MLKKMVQFQLVFFVVFCLSIFFAHSDGHAAFADCEIASVYMIGPTPVQDNNVAVFLINQTSTSVGTWAPNTSRMFYLYEPLTNQGLAVLLTAYSMNKNVQVRVESADAAAGSLISYIYLKK